MELAESADVINMRVRADDGLNFEFVPAQKIEDAMDFVAGIDDQRFARDGVANDGAIALKHSYRNGDVNQSFGRGIQRRQTIAHAHDYIIGHGAIPERGCMVCGAF
jgi:hypothetical protein